MTLKENIFSWIKLLTIFCAVFMSLLMVRNSIKKNEEVNHSKQTLICK